MKTFDEEFPEDTAQINRILSAKATKEQKALSIKLLLDMHGKRRETNARELLYEDFGHQLLNMSIKAFRESGQDKWNVGRDFQEYLVQRAMQPPKPTE